MTDQDSQQSIDPDYASALGAAVYAFASLEWHAVQCCERIRPGSIDELMDRTAGRVADTLNHLAGTLPPSRRQQELDEAASDFRAFVGTRNNLLHAKPGVDGQGRRRLFRDGDQWTIEELGAVAAAFDRCTKRLGDWLAAAGSGA